MGFLLIGLHELANALLWVKAENAIMLLRQIVSRLYSYGHICTKGAAENTMVDFPQPTTGFETPDGQFKRFRILTTICHASSMARLALKIIWVKRAAI